jgi:hypothetical protein
MFSNIILIGIYSFKYSAYQPVLRRGQLMFLFFLRLEKSFCKDTKQQAMLHFYVLMPVSLYEKENKDSEWNNIKHSMNSNVACI